VNHKFGGSWTEEKLGLLVSYLIQYLRIFHGNPRAKFFRTWYVDAFAGSGHIQTRLSADDEALYTIEGQLIAPSVAGSAVNALQLNPGFHNYLFIEKNVKRARELDASADAYRAESKQVQVVRGEANVALKQWMQQTNWSKNRAVVFLDPYGMQVEWGTIEALAATKAVDLWLLFPLSAVNRLLTKRVLPPDEWSAALTRIFGTDGWREAFYTKERVTNLFEDYEVDAKAADFSHIASFFLERLQSIFAAVSPTARVLRNSAGAPLFLLCFAAANQNGARPAIRIARHLLGK
jgi:three-Cys-motif partner protein